MQGNSPFELGGGGGSFGYNGINNSVALGYRVFDGNVTSQTALLANQTALSPFATTGAVNIFNAGAVSVALAYNGTTLSQTLTQGANVFTTSYAVDIPTLVGGNTAYIGFTGATGGLNMNANVSSFQFNGAAVAVPEGNAAGMLLLGLPILGGAFAARCTRQA